MLYASNFSLGVNLFFALNIALAKLMNPYKDYDVSIEEIHHVNKKDAPSGTAITLANDIINVIDGKECWINEIYKKGHIASIYVIVTNPSKPSVIFTALELDTSTKRIIIPYKKPISSFIPSV